MLYKHLYLFIPLLLIVGFCSSVRIFQVILPHSSQNNLEGVHLTRSVPSLSSYHPHSLWLSYLPYLSLGSHLLSPTSRKNKQTNTSSILIKPLTVSCPLTFAHDATSLGNSQHHSQPCPSGCLSLVFKTQLPFPGWPPWLPRPTRLG